MINSMTVIRAYGTQLNIACDQCCQKAWGLNGRERVQLSDDDEDWEWLSDNELGIAPVDPRSYEGGDGKPLDGKHNRWCLRECERSSTAEFPNIPSLDDFSDRIRNR